jgi:hypothetical protein
LPFHFCFANHADCLAKLSVFVKESYDLLLNFFHSNALNLSRLLDLWVKLALRLFNPVTEEGFVLLAADGLKVPKEGKKMPAVKSLHQESGNNSKPEFIMGHSFQAVSLLVHSALGQVFAVPQDHSDVHPAHPRPADHH